MKVANGILRSRHFPMYLPRGAAQPPELTAKLIALKSSMPPVVVHWRYTIDKDWSGDPALFFWVTLSNDAAKPENLAASTTAVHTAILQHIDPIHDWGLIPYFNFRSQSEQAALKEEVFG
jgi:hypothetical protein